jgi:hypothetical protein
LSHAKGFRSWAAPPPALKHADAIKAIVIPTGRRNPLIKIAIAIFFWGMIFSCPQIKQIKQSIIISDLSF